METGQEIRVDNGYLRVEKTTDKAVLLKSLDLNRKEAWFPKSIFIFEYKVDHKNGKFSYRYSIKEWFYKKLNGEQFQVLGGEV